MQPCEVQPLVCASVHPDKQCTCLPRPKAGHSHALRRAHAAQRRTRVLSLLSVPSTASRMRSSTAAAMAARLRRRRRARVWMMAASTRSRTIWSTSRPWKPTSVNLVASTCSPAQARGGTPCLQPLAQPGRRACLLGNEQAAEAVPWRCAPSQTARRPAWPAAARSLSSRTPWGRSSGCSLGLSPPAGRAAAVRPGVTSSTAAARVPAENTRALAPLARQARTFMGLSILCRRHLFLSALATARFASA